MGAFPESESRRNGRATAAERVEVAAALASCPSAWATSPANTERARLEPGRDRQHRRHHDPTSSCGVMREMPE